MTRTDPQIEINNRAYAAGAADGGEWYADARAENHSPAACLIMLHEMDGPTLADEYSAHVCQQTAAYGALPGRQTRLALGAYHQGWCQAAREKAVAELGSVVSAETLSLIQLSEVAAEIVEALDNARSAVHAGPSQLFRAQAYQSLAQSVRAVAVELESMAKALTEAAK